MAKTVVFHEYGGPKVLRLEDVPVGEPGPGEVRIRVRAIGVNRAEALDRAGIYIEQPRSFPGRLGAESAESAGIVEAVGSGVSGFAPGDAVSTVPQFSHSDYAVYAVYAEQTIVPASADRLRAATGGRGVELVLDAVAGPGVTDGPIISEP
jgi:NADPH:quinone reductase-like Zn-dependent oxidoreductase